MDYNFYVKLGEALRTERNLHHYTMEQIADYIGVNKSTVMRWEHGKTEMSAKSLIMYLEFMHVTVADFARRYNI